MSETFGPEKDNGSGDRLNLFQKVKMGRIKKMQEFVG